MIRVIAVMLALAGIACGGGQGYSPTQASPSSPNQDYMISEMKRLEPKLDIGEFIAKFGKPPAENYAGWANCVPGGKPPWIVNFNEAYVETLTSTTYMTALVAHEMCHHWVTKKGGGCWDEQATELCAHNLTTKGNPNG